MKAIHALTLFFLLSASAMVSCGADRFGHSKVYEPLSAEADALNGAEEFDPVMARRQPDAWAAKKVGVFGVVVQREDEPGDKANLVVQVRSLEPRNLCMAASSSSCRTTVSENGFDRIRVRVTMHDKDDVAGETSIGQGSLVRVVGKIVKNDEQGLTIDASYYRHWPRGYYVTTASQGTMRR